MLHQAGIDCQIVVSGSEPLGIPGNRRKDYIRKALRRQRLHLRTSAFDIGADDQLRLWFQVEVPKRFNDKLHVPVFLREMLVGPGCVEDERPRGVNAYLAA